MPRPKRPWFRFYVEATRDTKLRRLTPAQRWLWVSVLAAARESCIPGWLMLSERMSLTDADLADLAGMKEKDVSVGMTAMEELGLIEMDSDLGAWCVPKFAERQFESDDVTARTAKHRSQHGRKNVPTSPVGTPPETEA